MLCRREILLWLGLLLLTSFHAVTSINTPTNEQEKTSTSPEDSAESTKPINESKPLRIAFCVNGQLARLELYSKIKNIFIPNARIGNLVHVFIYLDNEVNNVKQTYWNYDYSNSMYGSHNRKEIKAIVDDAATITGLRSRIRTRVLLQPPPRHLFPVNNNGTVPVQDKPFTGHDGPHDLFETAASRFQNNMRWMAGKISHSIYTQLTNPDWKISYRLSHPHLNIPSHTPSHPPSHPFSHPFSPTLSLILLQPSLSPLLTPSLTHPLTHPLTTLSPTLSPLFSPHPLSPTHPIPPSHSLITSLTHPLTFSPLLSPTLSHSLTHSPLLPRTARVCSMGHGRGTRPKVVLRRRGTSARPDPHSNPTLALALNPTRSGSPTWWYVCKRS